MIDQALADPAGHLWLFSSSEAVTNLLALAPGAPGGAHALATHSRIADAARRAGFATVAECAARIEAVVDAVRGQGVRGSRGRLDDDRPHGGLLE
jgi:uroporphyrinogen-III synthase